MSIRVVRTPEGLVAHVHHPTGVWYARKQYNGMLSRTHDHKEPWIVVNDLPVEVFSAFWKFEEAEHDEIAHDAEMERRYGR